MLPLAVGRSEQIAERAACSRELGATVSRCAFRTSPEVRLGRAYYDAKIAAGINHHARGAVGYAAVVQYLHGLAVRRHVGYRCAVIKRPADPPHCVPGR